jgi:capsular exopolysaccharide synthesis family protein
MDLAGYLSILRHRLLPLLLCVVAGAAGGYYRGHHAPKMFQATARVLVSQQFDSTLTVQSQLAGAQLSTSFLGTYAEIAHSQSVAQKVVQQLQLPETAQGLQKKFSAVVEPETFIIDVNAIDHDPVRARALADATALALGDRVDELEAGKPSPVRAQLLDRASLPTVPFSPRPKTDFALGLLLGVVAGLSVVALLESLDRTVKTSKQADTAFAAPMLSLVPRRRKSSTVVVRSDESGHGAEAYRALRTAVQFAQTDTRLRTILVTSAGPGEGKTTTAINLALALAASGDRVALVDADLRRSTLAAYLGLEQAVGLGSLVLRTVELHDALQPWADGMLVLPTGRPLPPNPSEILGSQLMSWLLEQLSDMVDVVVIDTPPVLPVTDAVALSTQVDAVVLVARHGKTRRASAAEARRRLNAVDANVIGYVLNAVPNRQGDGYYADYSYASTTPQASHR